MTSQDYLQDLEAELQFLPAGERKDIILEFASHIDEVRSQKPDLSEEELIACLPPPEVMAAEFRAESPAAGAQTGGRAAEGDSQGGAKGGRRGLNDHFRSFFRYATGEAQDIYQEFEAIQRMDIVSIATDIDIRLGPTLSCAVDGYWQNEEDGPVFSVSGSRLRLELGRYADNLRLSLPPDFAELLVKTASGNISGQLNDDALAILQTASGDIRLEAQNGAVKANSASGDVSLSGRLREAEVKTASGDISISGLESSLKLATASGDVQVRCDGQDIEGSVSTVSGDILLKLAADSRSALRATSVSGDIAIPGAKSQSRPGRKSAERAGGPGELKLVSLSGDIRVH